jgi:hypothetical protein
MAGTSLEKKLRMAPGQRMVILGEKEATHLVRDCAPEGVEWCTAEDKNVDYVHIFARYQTQLMELLPLAQACIKHDGLLWISYPKKSAKTNTDLDREITWQVVEPFGIRPVMQISVDSTWSALRFRPKDMVGK